MITILYFGVLKQRLGVAQEQMAWGGGTGRELLHLLQRRGGAWAEALEEDRIFRLAVDKQIVGWDVRIPDGAEVGLLPPVTGG